MGSPEIRIVETAGPVIKILFCEKGSGSGGSANALYHLLSNLDRTGFRAFVLIQRQGTKSKMFEAAQIVEYYSAEERKRGGAAGFFIYIVKSVLPEFMLIRKFIRKERIDIVHVNNSLYAGMAALAAAFVTRRPCVVFTRQTRKPLRREKWLARLASRVIVLNEFMRQSYAEFIPSDKLRVIYDGIDMQTNVPDRPDDPNPVQDLDGKMIVGLAGRVMPGKGYEVFLQAAEYVADKAKDVEFMIVGDGRGEGDAYCRKIQELAERSGISARIHFTGWREDVLAVMRCFSVLVVPYTQPEGLPNIILDAMRLGIPVVSSRIPGPEEIVTDRVDGLLVEVGNSEAVGKAVLNILGDSAFRDTIVRNAKQRVAGDFDIRRTVRKVETLYHCLLSGDQRDHEL